jgi:hypothetical protein
LLSFDAFLRVKGKSSRYLYNTMYHSVVLNILTVSEFLQSGFLKGKQFLLAYL